MAFGLRESSIWATSLLELIFVELRARGHKWGEDTERRLLLLGNPLSLKHVGFPIAVAGRGPDTTSAFTFSETRSILLQAQRAPSTTSPVIPKSRIYVWGLLWLVVSIIFFFPKRASFPMETPP